MSKKTFAFLLIVVMCLSAIPTTIFSAENSSGGASKSGVSVLPVIAPTPVYDAPVLITPADGSVLPYGVIEISWKCEGQPVSYNVRLRESNTAVGITFPTRDKFFKLAPEKIKPNVKYILDIGAVYNPIVINNTANTAANNSSAVTSYIKWSAPVTFAMSAPIPTPTPTPKPTPTLTPAPTPIYAVPVIVAPADGSVLPYGVIEISWKCEGQPTSYNVRLRESNSSVGITFETREKFFKLAPEKIKPNVKYILDIGAIYNPIVINNTANTAANNSSTAASYIKWSVPVTFVMSAPIPIPTPTPKPTPTPTPAPTPTPIYAAPVIVAPADGSVLPYGVIEISWKCEGQPTSYNVRLRESNSSVGITFETREKFFKLAPEKIKPNVKYILDIGAVYSPMIIINTADTAANDPSAIKNYIKWSVPVTFAMSAPIPTPTPTAKPTPKPTPIPTPIYGTPVLIAPADGSVLPYGVIDISWKCKGQPAGYNVRLRESNSSGGIIFVTKDKFFKLAPEKIKPNVKYILDIGAVYNPVYITNTAKVGANDSSILPNNVKWSKPIVFSMKPRIVAAPVILAPKNGEVLPLADVRANWTPLNAVSYYVLTVKRLNATTSVQQPVIQVKTTVPNYTIPAKLLAAGAYSMSVAAFWENGVTAESAPVSFSIKGGVSLLPAASSGTVKLVVR